MTIRTTILATILALSVSGAAPVTASDRMYGDTALSFALEGGGGIITVRGKGKEHEVAPPLFHVILLGRDGLGVAGYGIDAGDERCAAIVNFSKGEPGADGTAPPPDVTLRFNYDAKKGRVEIAGNEFDLERSNLFFVEVGDDGSVAARQGEKVVGETGPNALLDIFRRQFADDSRITEAKLRQKFSK